ncbi:MAG: hypothetical protein FJ147_13730 [Deltaproteobacteria bacterium]|nr:hypothetical protein [Deltaproteobacteria bacterium]
MEKGLEVRRGAKGNQATVMSWTVDYVPAEQNLETIGYFSARYARKALDEKQKSKVIVLSDNRRIEIVPSMKYGFPNAEDLDFYRAFLKICDERAQLVKVEVDGQTVMRPRLPSPIGFSSRELIAKAGRTKNGRGHSAVRSWIERLNSTTIHGELFNARERKFDVRMGIEPLFRKYVHVGRPLPNGEIASQNFVWLADWFVENYFYLYSRPIDLKFHHRLTRSISKALYPLLDNGWFAANGHPYTKRYSDLCALLDIQVYQQMSRVQQQLDPSNEELLREKFVASYDYPVDASGAWSGTVRWWPGPKWIYDQEQRKRPKGRNTELVFSEARGEIELTVTLNPQLSLSLDSADEKSDDGLYRERVSTFYEKLGQGKTSREKLHSGAKLLRSLVEEEGYTLADVDFSLDWIVGNVEKKFDGRVKSIGVLPHVIGEALGQRAQLDKKKQKTEQSSDSERSQTKMVAERKELEVRLHQLPQKEQDNLRQVATAGLMEQGIPQRFLLEAMVTAEMCRLLQQREITVKG